MRNNEFTSNFLDKYIGKQLSRLLEQPSPKKTTVEKAVVYFSMNYLGPSSFNIRNNLLKLVKDHYPQINIRVIFKSAKTLQNMFRVKDKIPSDLKSSITYLYKCGGCSSTYVGKSLRHLRARTAEHQGRSFRTGQLLAKPSYSAIREHSLAKDHPISITQFSILSTHRSDMELRIAECLHTKRLKPDLGGQDTSIDLICF